MKRNTWFKWEDHGLNVHVCELHPCLDNFVSVLVKYHHYLIGTLYDVICVRAMDRISRKCSSLSNVLCLLASNIRLWASSLVSCHFLTMEMNSRAMHLFFTKAFKTENRSPIWSLTNIHSSQSNLFNIWDAVQTAVLSTPRTCLNVIIGTTFDDMGRVKRICVFEHSVMTNFNCTCLAIQRGLGSGFLSEGSSWLTACMSEQRRFWRDCADAQARLNLRCSHRR